jgi:hypothetical protein
MNPNGSSGAADEVRGIPDYGCVGVVFRLQRAMPEMERLAG